MKSMNKYLRAGLILLVMGLAIVAWSWQSRAEQPGKFDKLSDEDRQAFSKRFEKEIWPLMVRGGGKESCFQCHKPGHISGLRPKEKEADKVFRQLLKEGFFLPDDEGAILFKITHKNPKERMPPAGKAPAWNEKEIDTLRQFVMDIKKKQKK